MILYCKLLFGIEKGASIGFAITKEGVVILPCKVEPYASYTAKQWTKIHKLAEAKEKVYGTTAEAIKHIQNL